MPTTFLFAETLNETGCECLLLENPQTVSMPLLHRTFSEIKAMQQDTTTMVVLPASLCGLHRVELPWLGYRKAQAAIPFALEEQLVEPLMALHFAFDRAHHANNCYLVVVIAKKIFSEMLHRLQDSGIQWDEVTLDWFALNQGEGVVSSSEVLLRTDTFQGALKGSLATHFLQSESEGCVLHGFRDSKTEWKRPSFSVEEEPYFVWIAKRLLLSKRINLCQGEYALRADESIRNYPLLLIAAASVGLWIASILLVNAVNLMRLHAQIKQVDSQITTVYHRFFPNARQIVNPKFQITQLLNTGHVEKNALLFWQLLEKFEQVMHQYSAVSIQQMEYHTARLTVSLVGPDFATLEQLEDKLKQAKLIVTQTQATTHEKNVSATLELRL